MGILGSSFGRALAGAAGAAGALANRYIDEELAQQRAQALADIQRRNAQGMREDADAFDNDPKRLERNRDRVRKDALSAGRTSREVELEGLNDPALEAARTAKGDRDSKNATRRKVEEIDSLTPAEARRVEALGPVEAKRAGLVAEAQARVQAKYREPRQDGVSALNEKLAAIDKMDFLDPQEKQAAKKALVGLGRQRDPELDTETVKVQEMQPDGTMKETTRKQVRRPGQAGPAGPEDDPIKAAMDAARAAKDKKPAPSAAGTPAAATATQQAGSGLLDKARQALSTASESAKQSGSEYQMIDRRVREAGRGGPPLTQQEIQLARKWRLPV